MFESHVVTSFDRTSFDFLFEDFFEQFVFVNNCLLCYWPTIHFCPKFQVLSSHVFEVDELLNEHRGKIVQSEIFSTTIYVECHKMYQLRFVLKNSDLSCLALIFNLSNKRTTILQAKKLFQVARYEESYTMFFTF